jgi:hypothetical protein
MQLILVLNICNSVLEFFSTHIISDFDHNNCNILIAFYEPLFLPQYVLKNKNCETENALNWWKHVVLCNKWNVVVFGRILS